MTCCAVKHGVLQARGDVDKAFVDCAVVIMQLAVAVRPAVNCLLRRRLKDFGHAFDVAE